MSFSLTLGKYFLLIETTINPIPSWGQSNIGYAIEYYIRLLFLEITIQKPIGIRGIVKEGGK